jgi:hypothetical protein
MPQNRPSFSSPPRDVKDLIFDMAFKRGSVYHSDSAQRLRCLIRPFSKALLGSQRVALYGDVRLTSYRQLARFAQTVTKNLDIAKAVKNVVVEFEWKWEGGLEFPVKEEKADANTPPSPVLAALFQATVNLEYLAIVGSSRVAKVALSSPNGGSRFQHLQSLILESNFSGWSDPYHLSHLVSLQNWTKLHHFTYVVERDADEIEAETTAPFRALLDVPHSFPSLNSINSLELGGPLSKPVFILKLFPLFPSLTSLSLDDTSPSPANFISKVFDALPNPHLLTQLEVSKSDSSHPSDISPLIPLLPALEVLEIGGEGVQVKARFFEQLKKLTSLRLLTFNLGVRGITTSELTKLLTGPNRHSSLKQCYLDHIKDCAHEGSFPEWTKRFKPQKFEQLLDKVEKEGVIHVDGDAVWALRMGEEISDIDELIEDIPMLKERYRNFAIGLQQQRMEED